MGRFRVKISTACQRQVTLLLECFRLSGSNSIRRADSAIWLHTVLQEPFFVFNLFSYSFSFISYSNRMRMKCAECWEMMINQMTSNLTAEDTSYLEQGNITTLKINPNQPRSSTTLSRPKHFQINRNSSSTSANATKTKN